LAFIFFTDGHGFRPFGQGLLVGLLDGMPAITINHQAPGDGHQVVTRFNDLRRMPPTQNAHERIVRHIRCIAGVMQLTFEPPVQPGVVLLVDVLNRSRV